MSHYVVNLELPWRRCAQCWPPAEAVYTPDSSYYHCCPLCFISRADTRHAAAQHAVIDGGITNLLWKVLPPEEAGLGAVVVRVFGEETDRMIDRARELRILLQLNEAGFGARVRGL